MYKTIVKVYKEYLIKIRILDRNLKCKLNCCNYYYILWYTILFRDEHSKITYSTNDGIRDKIAVGWLKEVIGSLRTEMQAVWSAINETAQIHKTVAIQNDLQALRKDLDSDRKDLQTIQGELLSVRKNVEDIENKHSELEKKINSVAKQQNIMYKVSKLVYFVF